MNSVFFSSSVGSRINVTMRNALLLALGLATCGFAAPLEGRQANDITLEAEDAELSGTEVLTDLAGFSGRKTHSAMLRLKQLTENRHWLRWRLRGGHRQDHFHC